MTESNVGCDRHRYAATEETPMCPFCTYQILGKAFMIGEIAHESVKQVRKYSGVPYFNHPMEIATRMFHEGCTLPEIAAVLLHDVVEDTGITEEILRRYFSDKEQEVVDIVMMVTKPSEDESEPRTLRKQRDHLHYAEGNRSAQTVKCYDIEHNGHDLLEQDRKFAKTWFAESYVLLDMLKNADPHVHRRVREFVVAAYHELNPVPPFEGAIMLVPGWVLGEDMADTRHRCKVIEIIGENHLGVKAPGGAKTRIIHKAYATLKED